MQVELDLPKPDAERIERSQRLKDILLAEIGDGHMDFARYMQQALYHPEYGYYAGHYAPMGVGGDFVTAPMLSPVFSQCVANQAEEVLAACETRAILELGAGTGAMAAEILAFLSVKDALPDHYYILEVSGALKQTQKQTLMAKVPDLLSRVVWLDKLPEQFSGLIVGNEVLDAMPCSCLEYQDGEILRCDVGQKDGELIWSYHPHPKQAEIIDYLAPYELEHYSRYRVEYNKDLADWLKSLEAMLTQGVMILFDYGYAAREYYGPNRAHGTLRCYYQQRLHDNPFFYPGLQDLTYHVDFTYLAEMADRTGLEILGFTNQAGFLLSNDFLGLLAKAPCESEAAEYQRQQAIHMLTSPQEMGELMKVIAIGKNIDDEPRGFLDVDLLGRL